MDVPTLLTDFSKKNSIVKHNTNYNMTHITNLYLFVSKSVVSRRSLSPDKRPPSS